MSDRSLLRGFPFLLTIALALSPLAGAHEAPPTGAKLLEEKVVSEYLVGLKPVGNPGILELDPTDYKRIVVLSDTHGSFSALLKLLEKSQIIQLKNGKFSGLGKNLATPTLIVILGDSIDKGDASIQILKFWAMLAPLVAKTNGQVVHLLGNHEAEFLEEPLKNNEGIDLIDELIKDAKKDPQNLGKEVSPAVVARTFIQGPVGTFLRQMPLALVLRTQGKPRAWLLSHAGHYNAEDWSDYVTETQAALNGGYYGAKIITGKSSIVQKKDWWKDEEEIEPVVDALGAADIGGLIFGHQTSAFQQHGKIAGNRLLSGSGIYAIKTDSGMAPEPEGLGLAGELLLIEKPSTLVEKGEPKFEVVKAKGTGKPEKLKFGVWP